MAKPNLKRLDPVEALAAVDTVAPRLPPTRAPAPPADDRSGMFSIRLRESTMVAIARAAGGSGRSQRLVVAEALRAAGIDVAPADLVDSKPARRRWSGDQ